MKFSLLLKQMLLVGVCLFALNGQAMADAFTDAQNAYVAGNYAKAEKLFRPLAEQGNASAQDYLGWMYYIGREGVPQNYNEAVKWSRLAAEQGDAPAQLRLAEMYEDGKGVLQDYKETARWTRIAAEEGDASGQYLLATLYQYGEGVSKDYVLAHMWSNIAAANDKSIGYRDSAILKRDTIATLMTVKQIAEAQELARKCTANKFKGC